MQQKYDRVHIYAVILQNAGGKFRIQVARDYRLTEECNYPVLTKIEKKDKKFNPVSVVLGKQV